MQFVIIAVEKCCLGDFFQTAFNKTKTLYPSVKLKQKKQHCCWCLTTRNFFSYTALFFTPVVFFSVFLKEVWASEMQNVLFLEFSSTISLTFKMALFFKGLFFCLCVCFFFFCPFPVKQQPQGQQWLQRCCARVTWFVLSLGGRSGLSSTIDSTSTPLTASQTLSSCQSTHCCCCCCIYSGTLSAARPATHFFPRQFACDSVELAARRQQNKIK